MCTLEILDQRKQQAGAERARRGGVCRPRIGVRAGGERRCPASSDDLQTACVKRHTGSACVECRASGGGGGGGRRAEAVVAGVERRASSGGGDGGRRASSGGGGGGRRAGASSGDLEMEGSQSPHISENRI
ncbi:hypothetical protein PR003_g15755 [Phytophthora rubi]|uniref:Uncharacterized protein n=1 Tax=Phytophthora rubi TaxID=129364 RepID=A0A6A4EVK4_9STRA|nr:hypothetical protein PR003_g15755 [Phytophthora rubi]